jgi:hypothetical protein
MSSLRQTSGKGGVPPFILPEGKNNQLFGKSWFFIDTTFVQGSVYYAGTLFLDGAGFRFRITRSALT